MISPFFFFPPHIQGLSSLTDSPSPSSTPLTQAPAGCLYSHHPTRSPGEKFSLCIFIVVAHTNTVPHESFISLSFSLVPTLSPSVTYESVARSSSPGEEWWWGNARQPVEIFYAGLYTVQLQDEWKQPACQKTGDAPISLPHSPKQRMQLVWF